MDNPIRVAVMGCNGRMGKVLLEAIANADGVVVADEVEKLPGRLGLGGAEQVRHAGDEEGDASRLQGNPAPTTATWPLCRCSQANHRPSTTAGAGA